jgi:L-ascorbate metabolism protein UlaG (beta-lactamase superfamily)
MRVTKFTHACVRLEHDGGVLVIDPGIWAEPAALVGADAVLITHEHVDHIDVMRLAGARLSQVHAPAGARIGGLDDVQGLDVTPVEVDAELDVAGCRVRAVGGRHAYFHGEQPDCANVGYVIDTGDGRLYHPGDALHVPDEPIETLLVPSNAPWLKLTEAIDFVNAVRPRRAFPIHDGLMNELGAQIANRLLDQFTETDYRYLRPGESLD